MGKELEQIGFLSKFAYLLHYVGQYRETEILGRNGKVYEDLKTYGDIIIPVEFNFIEYDPNEFNERFRKIKRWVNNIKDEKLKFSDDFFAILQSNLESFDNI